MLHLNDLKSNVVYDKKLLLPQTEDKYTGNLIMLLSPHIMSSVNSINNKIFVNKYFNSYYLEKDISIYLNSIEEKALADKLYRTKLDYIIYENSISIANNNNVAITEDETYNKFLKNLLYDERMKTNKDLLDIYDFIKEKCDDIKYTYLYPERYKNRNLFLDFYYYNESFFNNNTFTKDKGIDLYLELINRFINDKRFSSYKNKYLIIPVDKWKEVVKSDSVSFIKYTETINPISLMYRIMIKDYKSLQNVFKDTTLLFTSGEKYMKLDLDDDLNIQKFLSNMNNKFDKDVEITPTDTKDAIKNKIIDELEDVGNIKIRKLTGDDKEQTITANELEKKIDDVSSSSDSKEEAIEKLNNDEEFKNALIALYSNQYDSDTVSKARRERISKVNSELLKKNIGDKTIEDILNEESRTIESTDLHIDSPNEEWSDMKFINYPQTFNTEQEIIKSLLDFEYKSLPLAVLDVSIKDNSTSEDIIDEYTIQFEDSFGKRFTIKVDVPKYIDDKFLKLKGNVKKVSGQLILKPIIKTDRDTVQVVTNYNKIFIKPYGQRVNVVIDRIIKTISNKNPSGIKFTEGYNHIANNSYILPIDYEYMGNKFSTININNEIIVYFNQKEIREKYNIDDNIDKLPYGYDLKNKKVLYANLDDNFSIILYNLLKNNSKDFEEKFNSTSVGKKYIYSRASIMSSKVPVILVCAYSEGLTRTLNKANIEYELHEKRPKIDYNQYDIIKFSDGYLTYKITPESSLFMNGLKDCGTENYSILEINKKDTYLEMLDNFGNRLILSDGLDNFYDLMIDSKTKEILETLHLPTDYVSILIYASNLLAYTDYNKHIDLNGYRYRKKEIIYACMYSAIADSYEQYKRDVKMGKKNATMTINRSAVITELLLLPTTADLSIISPLYEIEAANEVSTKGKNGLNAERAYGVDKRSYDKSMLNNIAMSTNFATTVGVNRVMTVNANIMNDQGFMKTDTKNNELGINTFCATELMTPFGALHSDNFRTAMTFIQKSKHQMRTKISHPNIITTGMDDAMAYMISNTFVYKTKDDGVVLDLTDEYILIEYKDGSRDIVDLTTNVVKNSDGGFYSTLTLIPRIKKSQKFKKGEIIAYDPQSFSTNTGSDDNITCDAGTFIKVAKIASEETFEDSTIVSEWLTHAMSSDIVTLKSHVFSKNTIIDFIAEKGSYVEEGDPILIFQEGFEDEDIQKLLSKLSLSDDEVEVVVEQGKKKIKSKVTGWIEDIKMYRTVELEDMSSSLSKIFSKYESNIKNKKKLYKDNNMEDKIKLLDPDYVMDLNSGEMKGKVDAVKIVFYLRYQDDLSVGDKVVFYDALKGVIRSKFPEGKEPYTDSRPDEKIHAYLGLSSCTGRMVSSVDFVLGINKGLIELTRQCKDILGIKYTYLDGNEVTIK